MVFDEKVEYLPAPRHYAQRFAAPCGFVINMLFLLTPALAQRLVRRVCRQCRDSEAARRAFERAKCSMASGDLRTTEQHLIATLSADRFFAPAHNNLGTGYYRQRRLYLAAWEFQYAATLMPRKAEPRNNLGLVLESVSRLEDTLKAYEEAVRLEPDNPEYLGNLIRCRVRLGRRDGRTKELLQELLLKDTRPEWLEWARRQMMVAPPAIATMPAATQPFLPTTQPWPPTGLPGSNDYGSRR